MLSLLLNALLQIVQDDPPLPLVFEGAPTPYKHDEALTDAAVPAGGRRLFTLDRRGRLHAWGIPPEELFPGEGELIWSLSSGILKGKLRHDEKGRWIGVADLKGIRVWDARDGKAVAEFSARHARFAPDGHSLLGIHEDRVLRRSLPEGAEVSELMDPAEASGVAAASFDGHWVAAAWKSKRGISIWNALTGTLRSSTPLGPGPPHSGIAFSPGGQILASDVFSVDALEVREGVPGLLWTNEVGPLLEPRLDPAGVMLHGSHSRRLAGFWKPGSQTWGAHRRPPLHGDWIRLSEDGKFWLSAAGATLTLAPVTAPPEASATCLQAVRGTRFLVGDNSGGIREFDLVSKRFLGGHRTPSRPVQALSDDGRWALLDDPESGIQLWDLTRGTASSTFKPDDPLHSGTFAPGGTALALLGMSQAEVYPLTPGGPRFTLQTSGERISCLAWSGDGRQLAVGTRQGGIGIGLAGAPAALRLAPKGVPVLALALSGNGSLLSAAYADSKLQIWKGEPSASTPSVIQLKAPVHRLCFSPDGRWLATADSWGGVRVFPGAGGPCAGAAQAGTVLAGLAFSNDGALLIGLGLKMNVLAWKTPE